MPTKTTRKARPTASSPDPRIAALLEAFASDRELAPIAGAFEQSQKVEGSRRFGSNGLKVKGKLFALFTQGTLVVKLPRGRVATLVEAGMGTPFDPGHGRLMKEWMTVTSAKASWADLAREAHDFVKGPRR